MSFTLKINKETMKIADEDADMPLLWYLRENLNLKGTKFGCGIGQCGACSVHVNGEVMRACSLRLADLKNTTITTIEGLAPASEKLHPVQSAWLEIDVPQCGYCQAGQVMAAANLLSKKPTPSDADIDQAMTNICRCGSYIRIRKAVKLAAEKMRSAD